MKKSFILSEFENSFDVYKKLKSLLNKKGMEVFPFKKINYGIQFKIEFSGFTCTVRVYDSKKGVKLDLSQVGKEDIVDFIIDLLKGNDAEISEIDRGEFPLIGTDESGKGDYFGPLVCAGVYVDEESAKLLSDIGVRDCKDLNDKKNIELKKEIKKICSGKYEVLKISPERYNSLYRKFSDEGKNLNDLLAWAHSTVIDKMLKINPVRTVIVDRFASESLIEERLKGKHSELNLLQVTGAEENIAVAAASILARGTFLESLGKLSMKYSYYLPKGSTKKVLETARRIFNEKGIETLKKLSKLHFKLTDKLTLFDL